MCEMLGIERAQFFRLLRRYRQEQEKFTILYKRRTINEIPVRRYNYSCAAQTILKKDGVEVSYQTILKKAKQWS
ncbi:MAG: hypothetical protein LBD17_02930 [Endomicrobium sp.]|nr:hypothetical protein [Endomicrobium sp.]